MSGPPTIRRILKILHDPQYRKPWELCYYGIVRSCRILTINSTSGPVAFFIPTSSHGRLAGNRSETAAADDLQAKALFGCPCKTYPETHLGPNSQGTTAYNCIYTYVSTPSPLPSLRLIQGNILHVLNLRHI